MRVGCGGFLIGKPRWDAKRRAHPKPTQYKHMWAPHWYYMGPMRVGCGGFLIGKPRWDAKGRAHTKLTQSNTYGPYIGIILGPCVLVVAFFGRKAANGRAWPHKTHTV